MGSIATHIDGELGGQQVHSFTLTNSNGHQVRISELGACLLEIGWLDHESSHMPLLLGYQTFEERVRDSFYLGSTVGRFGNRIAHGRFSLDGKNYQLATNNDPGGIPCHLHGGPNGYNRRVWSGEPFETDHSQGVTFTLYSPDGDESYPGNLTIKVAYEFHDDNDLTWQATATTDQATPVNIINHAYWNLSGNPETTVHDHLLQINADSFLPGNQGMIPTGELAPVAGTPMDFTQPTHVGKRIEADFEPLHLARGYDHCWVLKDNPSPQKRPRTAAFLHHQGSGRTLELLTDQPGIQCYTGNFLSAPFGERTGICLETQAFPDTPNHPHFPSCILHPGETYSHKIIWRIS